MYWIESLDCEEGRGGEPHGVQVGEISRVDLVLHLVLLEVNERPVALQSANDAILHTHGGQQGPPRLLQLDREIVPHGESLEK